MTFKTFLQVFRTSKQIKYSPYSKGEYDRFRSQRNYDLELNNLLYTIPFNMRKLYAHVLAFDIYNCLIFNKISIYYKNNQYINIYQLLKKVSDNNNCTKARQAFHKASKITYYIYNCRYSDDIKQITDDNLTIEQRIYRTINTFIEYTGYTYNFQSDKQKFNKQLQDDDNILLLLQKQSGTGIIDRFVSQEEMSRSDNYNDTIILFDSHYPISKMITKQISNLRDQLEGIRKTKFESDIFNLLRGQYAYLNKPRIFFSLYARKELLTYNFPTNIISNKKPLISLITVCKPEIKYLNIKQLLNSQNIQNKTFDKEKLLPDSYFKLFYLEMIYDFIRLTQIKTLKKYFENSFTFTYRLESSITQNDPLDLSEQTIKTFWLEKMEFPVFKKNMHFNFPQIFFHDDSFVHKATFNFLYDCLDLNEKDVNTDLSINILFFIGYHNEDYLYKEIIYLLQKKYSSKNNFKAIIFMLDESLREGRLFVLKKKHQIISSENRFPLAVAHKIVESILFP